MYLNYYPESQLRYLIFYLNVNIIIGILNKSNALVKSKSMMRNFNDNLYHKNPPYRLVQVLGKMRGHEHAHMYCYDNEWHFCAQTPCCCNYVCAALRKVFAQSADSELTGVVWYANNQGIKPFDNHEKKVIQVP